MMKLLFSERKLQALIFACAMEWIAQHPAVLPELDAHVQSDSTKEELTAHDKAGFANAEQSAHDVGGVLSEEQFAQHAFFLLLQDPSLLASLHAVRSRVWKNIGWLFFHHVAASKLAAQRRQWMPWLRSLRMGKAPLGLPTSCENKPTCSSFKMAAKGGAAVIS